MTFLYIVAALAAAYFCWMFAKSLLSGRIRHDDNAFVRALAWIFLLPGVVFAAWYVMEFRSNPYNDLFDPFETLHQEMIMQYYSTIGSINVWNYELYEAASPERSDLYRLILGNEVEGIDQDGYPIYNNDFSRIPSFILGAYAFLWVLTGIAYLRKRGDVSTLPRAFFVAHWSLFTGLVTPFLATGILVAGFMGIFLVIGIILMPFILPAFAATARRTRIR